MEKSITYVGLDVHKNSIDVALADEGRDKEVRYIVVAPSLIPKKSGSRIKNDRRDADVNPESP